MDKPQVIVDDAGHPTFAVIPWHDYERLAAIGEDAEDAAICDRAKEQEAFPVEVVDRMLADENPIRVFRDYRRHDTKTARGEGRHQSSLPLAD